MGYVQVMRVYSIEWTGTPPSNCVVEAESPRAALETVLPRLPNDVETVKVSDRGPAPNPGALPSTPVEDPTPTR